MSNYYIKEYKFDNIQTNNALKKKIHNFLTKECKFGLGYAAVPSKGETGAYFLTYDKKDLGSSTPTDLNFILAKIIGTVELDIDSKREIAEIYTVCTHASYRGKGVMTFSMVNIIEKLYQAFSNLRIVWLSVSLENKNFSRVVRGYAKLGFEPVGIRNMSPMGHARPAELAMIFNRKYLNAPRPDMKVAVPSLVRDVTRLRDDFEYQKRENTTNFYMNVELMEFLYKLLTLSSERGGTLKIQRYTSQPGDPKEYGQLALNESDLSSGQPITCAVNVPTYYVNFHTHPRDCITPFKFYVSWPSNNDYYVLFTQGLEQKKGGVRNLVHLVITIEGVYVLKLTPDCMRYMKRMFPTFTERNIIYNVFKQMIFEVDQNKYIVLKDMKETTSYYMSRDFKFFESRERKITQNTLIYLRLINGVKISDIIKKLNELVKNNVRPYNNIPQADLKTIYSKMKSSDFRDFSMININLVPWPTIRRENGLLFHSNYYRQDHTRSYKVPFDTIDRKNRIPKNL